MFFPINFRYFFFELNNIFISVHNQNSYSNKVRKKNVKEQNKQNPYMSCSPRTHTRRSEKTNEMTYIIQLLCLGKYYEGAIP
jgi:hypothetical protein